MATQQIPETFITKAIRDSITAEIGIIANEEIAKAQAAIEKRLREKLGQIALGANSYYDMSRDGKNLIITVKNELKS